MKKFSKILITLVFCISPSFALAETPGETIQSTFDQVKKLVNESQGKDSAEVDKEIEKISKELFDFSEMSRRCLGASWKDISDKDRDKFVNLFSDLLAKTYIERIRTGAGESKFEIRNERTRGKKAIVKSVVELKEEKVSLDYKLLNKEESWRVYDVVIENVGLIGNYRDEFRGIIRKEGMPSLIKKLEEKIAKIKEKKEEKKS